MYRLRRKSVLMALGVMLLLLAPAMAVAQVSWIKSYDEALKQAQKEKKFVILDISASW